jgi:hypothetical protein
MDGFYFIIILCDFSTTSGLLTSKDILSSDAEQYGEASYMAGLIYDVGALKEGIEPNYTKAIEYYTRAAEAGVGLGAAGLGSIYFWNRPGIEVNHKKGIEGYLDAACIDNCPAVQIYIGFIFLNIIGAVGKMNADQSLKHFQNSLRYGYSFAQFSIDTVKRIQFVSSKVTTISQEDYARYEEIINDTISDLGKDTTTGDVAVQKRGPDHDAAFKSENSDNDFITPVRLFLLLMKASPILLL